MSCYFNFLLVTEWSIQINRIILKILFLTFPYFVVDLGSSYKG